MCFLFFQENDSLAGNLAFWMANASELLHFVKQDTSLSLFTETAQGILAQSVQHAFRFVHVKILFVIVSSFVGLFEH